MYPLSTGRVRQDAWQIRRHQDVAWRSWDGEVVVYDDVSGDTMKLDIIMSEIFRFLLPKPATLGDIVRHLASALDLKADDQLRHITTMALHRLREAALIQAISAAGPVGSR